MATAEAASRPHDRHARKRPFTGWMKRLANLKSSSSDAPPASGKKSQSPGPTKSSKAAAKNNPYPQSAQFTNDDHAHSSIASPVTQRSNESFTSAEEGESHRRQMLAKSNKSTAPTVATNPETVRSKAETGHSNMVGGGGGSTFSSPNHSERSLTTTLTTIQSTAPSNILSQPAQGTPTAAPPVQFSHQFPTSPPASAIPAHLAPQSHPTSYQAATANNMLTDNASILTLASSSKRRRRNSVDTNASVRALAPSSVWGGSRESLPLSVLSATGESSNIYSQTRPPAGAFANAERASVYSSSGVAAPALSSERNSYYANKQNVDGLSIRSGLLGHGRTESITGSIGAAPTSPLASPRDPILHGKPSRRSTDLQVGADGSEAIQGGEHVETPSSPVTSVHEDKGKAAAA